MTKTQLSTFTGPVLFSASWCFPCKTLKGQLSAANINVETIVVDEDEDGMAIAKDSNISTVPALVEYENGKAINTIRGGQDILSHFLHKKK